MRWARRYAKGVALRLRPSGQLAGFAMNVGSYGTGLYLSDITKGRCISVSTCNVRDVGLLSWLCARMLNGALRARRWCVNGKRKSLNNVVGSSVLTVGLKWPGLLSDAAVVMAGSLAKLVVVKLVGTGKVDDLRVEGATLRSWLRRRPVRVIAIALSTFLSGKQPMDYYRKVTSSITRTMSRMITDLKTWRPCPGHNITIVMERDVFWRLRKKSASFVPA